MKLRKLLILTVAVAVAAMMMVPAVAGAKSINMVPPVVTLDRVEVQNYFGFWIGTKEKPAEKGHAPLVLAFVFNIMNPNSLPVELDDFKFTVAFDGFDIATPMYANTMWIPAGKTNQLRVVNTFSSRAALLNLLVVAGLDLKDKGLKGPDLIKKWWVEAPNMSYPITVHGGAAQFYYDGGSLVSSFVGKFGGK